MKFRTKMVIGMLWLLALAYGIGGSLLIASSFHDTLEQEKNNARKSCQMLLNTLSILEDYGSVTTALQRLDSVGGTEWDSLLVQTGRSILFRTGSSEVQKIGHGQGLHNTRQGQDNDKQAQHGHGPKISAG